MNFFFLKILLFLCLLNLKIFFGVFVDFNGGLLVLSIMLFLEKILFGGFFFVVVLCFSFVGGFVFDIDFIMILIYRVIL